MVLLQSPDHSWEGLLRIIYLGDVSIGGESLSYLR
jgi:hypothetical protein